ncbi:MAG: HAD hydrolase-like protein [Clostridiales bacterium]|jgi:phosphoglycolate phosphatase|nr:HAD hydrolase-like protein [Clostridiales bacterium]
MPKYQSVIFDFDGTLVDSAPGIIKTFEALIQKEGLKQLSRRELAAMVGPPLHLSIPEVFGISSEAEVNRLVNAYRAIYAEIALPSLAAFPGAMEMLRALREAGVYTGVASCKIRHVCASQATTLGLAPYLCCICGAVPQEGLLEKADILRQAIAASRVSRENTVVVGDRMYDMRGAQLVGIPAIGVIYGSGSREELLPYAPLAIVEDIPALAKLLLM